MVAKKKRPVEKPPKEDVIPKWAIRQGKEFKAATEARYKMARAVYDAQDADTQEAIDRITARLTVHAHGTIKVYKDDEKRGKSFHINVGVETIQQNAFYMAVEMLKDLALFDVKIAGFEFLKKACATCGKTLKKKGS